MWARHSAHPPPARRASLQFSTQKGLGFKEPHLAGLPTNRKSTLVDLRKQEIRISRNPEIWIIKRIFFWGRVFLQKTSLFLLEALATGPWAAELADSLPEGDRGQEETQERPDNVVQCNRDIDEGMTRSKREDKSQTDNPGEHGHGQSHLPGFDLDQIDNEGFPCPMQSQAEDDQCVDEECEQLHLDAGQALGSQLEVCDSIQAAQDRGTTPRTPIGRKP